MESYGAVSSDEYEKMYGWMFPGGSTHPGGNSYATPASTQSAIYNESITPVNDVTNNYTPTSAPTSVPTSAPGQKPFDPRDTTFNKGRVEVFGMPAYRKALEAGYSKEEIESALRSSGLKMGGRLNAQMGNPNEWDEAKMAKSAAAAAKWEAMSKDERKGMRQERREKRAQSGNDQSLSQAMSYT